MSQSEVANHAQHLLQICSQTPDDAGCCAWLAARLSACGFSCESFKINDTTNFYARYGSGARVYAFVGHTDVVPPGPVDAWQHAPYCGEIIDGSVYGRGAVDMKGALAAMLAACERFFSSQPDLGDSSFVWLLTSDEEGPGTDGMPALLAKLSEIGVPLPDFALVGEPSSQAKVGDSLKIARRGSLTGYLTVHGQQGHAAYPEHAASAVNLALPALQDILALRWPSKQAIFPDTSVQCINLRSGVGVSNVIPGELSMEFNLRYAPEHTAEMLQAAVLEVLAKHLQPTQYQLRWRHSAQPYRCADEAYMQRCSQVVTRVTGKEVALTANGGTSDGRHLAASGAQVVELGLRNHLAHQPNECVPLADLELLERLYLAYLDQCVLNRKK